jgi:hypothetical protein
MGAKHPTSAQDEPAPPNPQRVWAGDRWIEAQTVCRDTLGRFTFKYGNEPASQLMLFDFGKGEAA